MRLKIWIAAAALLVSSMPVQAAGAFADWAAVIVAGDWHAHSGAPSEAFDNARRDIAADLVQIGFAPQNVVQFSVRPERYPTQAPKASDAQTIATSLWDLSNRTNSGCLVYFTSHGTPDGFLLNDGILVPRTMTRMITNACGDRPTVVVVSSCYSGQFVPALAASNRMILTAARRDRTSFGCGEADRYTFFDTCVLEYLTNAGDFPDLAKDVVACVSAREKKEHFAPPSEPQLSLGADVATTLPRWK
ncbi:MAG TPA: C13 family peptidase [Rhizomicrobium sp.]|nr:C13 family peptidase [Rhizomicrobium sp.]